MDGKDGEELEIRQKKAFDLEDLPPMLTPKHDLMRRQARRGIILVTALTSLLVTITYISALKGIQIYPVTFTFIGLITLEALVAFFSLCGVLLTDPGVIKRSSKTCLPPPPEVLELLKDSAQIRPCQYITSQSTNCEDIYCVRCLVWRQANVETSSESSPFCCPGTRQVRHCTTCQRCVRYHDHHCNVLGRCIGGVGLQGNLKYFKALFFSGITAVITCAVVISITLVINYGWWTAVVFLVMCVLCDTFFCRSSFLQSVCGIIHLPWRCWTSFIRVTAHRSQETALSTNHSRRRTNKRDDSQREKTKLNLSKSVDEDENQTEVRT